MKIIKSYKCIAFIGVILASCSNNYTNQGKDVFFERINKINVTGFKYRVPLDRTNEPDKIFKRILQMHTKLSMLNLDHGFEDFYIRISSDFNGSNKLQFCVIKFSNGKWESELVVYDQKADPKTKVYRKVTKSLTPRNGWYILANKLIDLNIFSLPSVNEIRNFDLVVGESPLNTFEIATKKTYQFYYYYDESILNHSTIPFCKNSVEIINLLKTELLHK